MQRFRVVLRHSRAFCRQQIRRMGRLPSAVSATERQAQIAKPNRTWMLWLSGLATYHSVPYALFLINGADNVPVSGRQRALIPTWVREKIQAQPSEGKYNSCDSSIWVADLPQLASDDRRVARLQAVVDRLEAGVDEMLCTQIAAASQPRKVIVLDGDGMFCQTLLHFYAKHV